MPAIKMTAFDCWFRHSRNQAWTRGLSARRGRIGRMRPCQELLERARLDHGEPAERWNAAVPDLGNRHGPEEDGKSANVDGTARLQHAARRSRTLALHRTGVWRRTAVTAGRAVGHARTTTGLRVRMGAAQNRRRDGNDADLASDGQASHPDQVCAQAFHEGGRRSMERRASPVFDLHATSTGLFSLNSPTVPLGAAENRRKKPRNSQTTLPPASRSSYGPSGT
jgi:hypothetical protein